MAGGLFDTGAPTSLQQALGDQANQAVAQTTDAYTQARKRLVGQQAHSGRLMSGVADYPLTDLAKEGAGAESDIYSQLASSLGAIPAEDTLNQNDYNRNLQLAQLIAQLQKPSALQETLGFISGGAKTAGSVASFF
jgi:hypothetical protein